MKRYQPIFKEDSASDIQDAIEKEFPNEIGKLLKKMSDTEAKEARLILDIIKKKHSTSEANTLVNPRYKEERSGYSSEKAYVIIFPKIQYQDKYEQPIKKDIDKVAKTFEVEIDALPIEKVGKKSSFGKTKQSKDDKETAFLIITLSRKLKGHRTETLNLSSEDHELSQLMDEAFPHKNYKLYKVDDPAIVHANVLFSVTDLNGEEETVKLLFSKKDVDTMLANPLAKAKMAAKHGTTQQYSKIGRGYVVFNDFENEEKFRGKRKVGAISNMPWYEFVDKVEEILDKPLSLPPKIRTIKDRIDEELLAAGKKKKKEEPEEQESTEKEDELAKKRKEKE